VKTAVHGNDPNWGRIICMAGTAAATFDLPFDADLATLKLCNTPVFRHGRPTKFNAAALSKKMAGKAMTIELACGLGDRAAHVYTCDLSREYITINADYHT
ncbi:MAG: bifunctional ornithine acetyltransferase/N-acetylglutamate synthase, partial [Planctomycetota bacterium]